MELATRYRLGKMTNEQAQRRLAELATKPMLEGDETEEAWALGDRLGVPVTIQRLELRTDAKWQTLKGRTTA